MEQSAFKNRIIRETTHWIGIDKPPGLIVENNPFESPSIESLVTAYLSEKYRNPYVGIVHRLDKLTSGVLLIAKRKSALRQLNEQFSKRKVKKTYQAVVESPPPFKRASLSHWLRKDQKNKKALIFEKEQPRTSKVQLRYKILREVPWGTLLEIFPLTGKFHQIRAQLSAIGCPIAGDLKYGSRQSIAENAIALSAVRLIFDDPKTGEKAILEAPESALFLAENN